MINSLARPITATMPQLSLTALAKGKAPLAGGALGSQGDFSIQAVTGTFSAGTLTTFGDSLDNNVTISRNAAGQLLINGGAVNVVGGTPTVAKPVSSRCSGRAATTSSR